MWWAFALIGWTLLSIVASPLIGSALAGGRALEVREDRIFAADEGRIPQVRRLA